MKIIYLHQYFVSPLEAGGTRSYEFARRLVSSGHQVYLITSSAMLSDTYGDITKTAFKKLDGIDLIIIPVPYSNKMSFSNRIKAFIKFAYLASVQALRLHADIILATSTPLTIAIPGIITTILKRIPMVFEVRDLWPSKPIAMGLLRNPIFRLLARLLERITYSVSDHIIVLSPDAVNKIAALGVNAEKITIIPNGCDVDLFDVSSSHGTWVRSKLGLEPKQPLVVYTGTLGHVNGLEYMISMAKQLRDSNIHFLVVGAGIEHDKLVSQAIEYGLASNFTFWDPMPKSKVPDILAASTVVTSFVIPVEELWDNSANKFFDGLAASKPIAINYYGWQSKILTQTGAGIVLTPTNPTEGALSLQSFLYDEEKLEKASKASRLLATEKFNRDDLSRKLESLLINVYVSRSQDLTS